MSYPKQLYYEKQTIKFAAYDGIAIIFCWLFRR